MSYPPEDVDTQSGYCSSDGIYYSKRPPVWLPENPNLDLLTFLFAPQYGDKIALIDAATGESMSYKELERKIRVLAAGLYKRLGVRKGDVVMLLSPNSIEFPVIFCAVVLLGGAVTTVNQVNTAGEIQKQMKDAGTKFIITIPELVEKVAGVDLPVVIYGEQEFVPDFGSKAAFRYSELLKEDPDDLPRAQSKQGDIVALLYSSGTTGTSKAVVLTHRHFIAASCIFNHGFDERRSPEDILLLVLPMFHVYGLAICTITSLAKGTTVVVLPKFDFVKMLDACQTYKVTNLPLVPPIIIALTKLDVVLKYDLSALVQIGSGAAPLGRDILIECAKRFPKIDFKQGYGLTESTGCCTTIPTAVDDMPDHFGSCGLLLPLVEAMVVDPSTGKPMPPTKQGELWIRGPCVMKEYLKNLKATTDSLDNNGWFHTGDLVIFDEDGHLFVVDRLKELIKFKGYQVAPAELEALLLSHPAVLDCAVIPFPDEEAGQIPMAYIVRKPNATATADDIMKWVSKQVAPYKKVRKLEFINAIPKSASGKILRRELSLIATGKSKL